MSDDINTLERRALIMERKAEEAAERGFMSTLRTYQNLASQAWRAYFTAIHEVQS